MGFATLSEKLHDYRTQNLWRNIAAAQKTTPGKIIIDGKLGWDFCSSDYLGLSQHPAVKKATITAIEQNGIGASASPLISGYSSAYRTVEQTLAQLLHYDDAVLFNSGYLANIGIIATLADRKTIIIADKHCHVSLLAGIQLSRATCYRYRHNDLMHLEKLLKKNPGAVVVTESVFSMSGAIAPLRLINQLVKQYHGYLIVDDAHGFGIIDHHIYHELAIDVVMISLSKALGTMGAIVVGNRLVVDSLRQAAKSYGYSTALPPAIVSATIAALSVFTTETWRRTQLKTVITDFMTQAAAKNLSLINQDLTPIKCLHVAGNQEVLSLQAQLAAQGFHVSAIRPPSVAADNVLLRICLNCDHHPTVIAQLLTLLHCVS